MDINIHSIMTADESGEGMVTFARNTAKSLVTNNLTRSQIRNIFSEVRQIEAVWEKADSTAKEAALRRLNMLKPKLAYQTARTSSMELLQRTLSDAIDEVTKSQAEKRDQTFKRFMELFEAILAYHRAEGGRN
ncbi:MAG: type III-A CRISPR-associated protein Csm2 [Chloroflexota bacterium]|jgi:CRISPR-associated protein Csm2